MVRTAMLDFLFIITIRFLGGVVLGCGACLVFGYKVILRSAAEGHFPIVRLIVWGVIGGLIAVFTTPRHQWPWNKWQRPE